MKLFQSLLVAPAALGLLAPLTANSSELNLAAISRYSDNNVESLSTFSELNPSDWSYQAIKDVVISRDCSNLIPSDSISRFEAAVIINSCLKDFAQITDQERRLIDEFNSELALIKSSIDDEDPRFDGIDASSFSNTTVASFSADFAIGAVDGRSISKTTREANSSGAVIESKTTSKAEALGFDYKYEVALTTSFTGKDSLDVVLAAGVGTLSEFDLSQDGGSSLVVDGISYTFPLGDKTSAFVSQGVEGSALFNTACVYGGPSDTLSSCGNVSSALDEDDLTATAGVTYDFGNGFTASVGYEGQGNTTAGIVTKESLDAYAGQLAYTTDKYGLSVTSAKIETSTTENDTFTALNAYLSPEETGLPSISVGYEWGDDGSAASNADKTSSYFVGLQWDELGQGVFGIAAGTHSPKKENGDALVMYEAFYSYPINDGMTITPLIYTKDMAAGTDDQTGIMVKTSFSF